MNSNKHAACEWLAAAVGKMNRCLKLVLSQSYTLATDKRRRRREKMRRNDSGSFSALNHCVNNNISTTSVVQFIWFSAQAALSPGVLIYVVERGTVIFFLVERGHG